MHLGAARPTTARRWINCAATSPAQHWPASAEVRCRDPGTAGDREDLHPPGSAGRARTQTVQWASCTWRGVRPLARRAQQGARRCPTITVQATRRPGPLESAASEGLRDRWRRPDDKGCPTDGGPRRTISVWAVNAQPVSASSKPRIKRVGCRMSYSGCHGEGKRGAWRHCLPAPEQGTVATAGAGFSWSGATGFNEQWRGAAGTPTADLVHPWRARRGAVARPTKSPGGGWLRVEWLYRMRRTPGDRAACP